MKMLKYEIEIKFFLSTFANLVMLPFKCIVLLHYFAYILTVLVHCDIEEAETRENEKLQHALKEMELQFEETKETLIREREAAKKLAKQTPTIQENYVVDNDLINKLTEENEQLKVNIT